MRIRFSGTRLRWAILLMATVMFASHWQVAPTMPDWDLFDFDKLAHFAVYGLLSTLIIRSLTEPSGWRKAALIAWISTVGFGLIDESIQALNPVRDFSLADLVADAAGASIALLAYSLWPFYRRILESHLWGRKMKSQLA